MSRDDPTSRPAILIVDDNHTFVDLTAEILRQELPDAEVGSAGSGEEALSQLVNREWDLVLLDYRLPDFDGLEVLAEIRKRLLDVAVVVITGEGDEALAADLFRMGAYDYLVKSQVSARSLTRTVSQVLMRKLLARDIVLKADGQLATSQEQEERNRALDIAYEKGREKKEQLRLLSNSLEATIQERTAELRSMSAFLNRVLDSTTDHFIIATDPQGVILTFNRGAEACFRLQATDVVGRRNFRTLFEESAESDAGLDSLVHQLGLSAGISREMHAVAADGSGFIARISLAPLAVENDAASQAGGLVIMGTDVTHEKQLEQENVAYINQIERANEDLRKKNQQILEATRLKSEFLANVSHELRTPLNAIIGYADLLLGEIYGRMAAEQVAAVDGVARRANDLLELINGILDLARIEAGQLRLRPEPFSLTNIMEELMETGRVLAVRKELTLDWTNDCEGAVEFHTDRQKLRQILFNLVHNAVKFTREGSIHIETSHADQDHVQIVVADSGVGIPPDALTSIFDEFRQADGTSTREYGGSGLGLTISRKFARLLGASITVTSELNRGSRFVLSVPRQLPESAASNGGTPKLASESDSLSLDEAPSVDNLEPGEGGALTEEGRLLG